MKKNVLFIITDDQRYDALGAANNKEIITPNLDRLVANGTMFTQAHIPCGTSGAICMPSRAMVNTGRNLFSIEREGQNIPAEHTTMAESFKNAGYDTFVTGKWHNGTPSLSRGFTGGDNIFFGGMWDHWNVPVCRHDPTGEYDNVINFTASFSTKNNVQKVHCDKFNPGVHSTNLLTDTAINYLSNQPDTSPFFLYLSYLAPHDPRTMPKEYEEMYNPETITLPPNYMNLHPFKFGVENIRDEILAPYPRAEGEVKKHLAEYYAMVTHLDHEIGRLLTSLEEKRLLEDTIIVMTSDNGLAVGSHGLMGKQNHYEHSVRVPLILAGPGIPKGQKADGYLYLLDIFPTLCDLCGLTIPESVEGRSFAKMLKDTSYVTRDSLYFVYNDLIRSVKDSRYKLIKYKNGQSQLFDLQNDPWEVNNLHDHPAYTQVVDRLWQLLQTHRQDWNDTEHPLSISYWS